MTWFIGQSAVMIGLAFVLGLAVGWLIWSGGRRRSARGIDAAASLPPAPVVKLPSPIVSELDDLERIEGIAPQMATALHLAGIRTYAQLAAADDGTLREAIKARGLRLAPNLETWAQQAQQLLADRDEGRA